MSPLVWDLGHIAVYEDLWCAHRLTGEPLLRPDLATAYDAFETPRAARVGTELLDRDGALEYLVDVASKPITATAAGAARTRGVLDSREKFLIGQEEERLVLEVGLEHPPDLVGARVVGDQEVIVRLSHVTPQPLLPCAYERIWPESVAAFDTVQPVLGIAESLLAEIGAEEAVRRRAHTLRRGDDGPTYGGVDRRRGGAGRA